MVFFESQCPQLVCLLLSISLSSYTCFAYNVQGFSLSLVGRTGASQLAQWYRICLPMHETQDMQIWSLDWEDPLEGEPILVFLNSMVWGLLLGRKVMTNLDSILKSRDITLSTKVCVVKAMVFPVVMYGCGSWTIKKAEHRRIDAFELWCWRRHLRVPWTTRRSNQSILKEISPECSLEGLMLKLKLQYFGHLMQRADSFRKTLMVGKIKGRRRRGQLRMR